MFTLHIKRTLELKAPFKICNDSQRDWTHFTHIHRKAISGLCLLYKNGRRISLNSSRDPRPDIPLHPATAVKASQTVAVSSMHQSSYCGTKIH